MGLKGRSRFIGVSAEDHTPYDTHSSWTIPETRTCDLLNENPSALTRKGSVKIISVSAKQELSLSSKQGSRSCCSIDSKRITEDQWTSFWVTCNVFLTIKQVSSNDQIQSCYQISMFLFQLHSDISLVRSNIKHKTVSAERSLTNTIVSSTYRPTLVDNNQSIWVRRSEESIASSGGLIPKWLNRIQAVSLNVELATINSDRCLNLPIVSSIYRPRLVDNNQSIWGSRSGESTISSGGLIPKWLNRD